MGIIRVVMNIPKIVIMNKVIWVWRDGRDA